MVQRDVGELVPDDFPQPLLRAQDRLQLGDLLLQPMLLLLQLQGRVPGQLAQPQLEDMLRLRFSQVEDRDQPGPCRCGVLCSADDLDDLVDVEDRDQQALHEVKSRLPLVQPVLGTTADHRDAVIEVDPQHLEQSQSPRATVDQGHVVDAEGVLHRRELIELSQHCLGVEPGFELDDHAQPVLAIGQVQHI